MKYKSKKTLYFDNDMHYEMLLKSTKISWLFNNKNKGYVSLNF